MKWIKIIDIFKKIIGVIAPVTFALTKYIMAWKSGILNILSDFLKSQRYNGEQSKLPFLPFMK